MKDFKLDLILYPSPLKEREGCNKSINRGKLSEVLIGMDRA